MIAQAESLAGRWICPLIKTELLTRIMILTLAILIAAAPIPYAAIQLYPPQPRFPFQCAGAAQDAHHPITRPAHRPRRDNVEIVALADGVIPDSGALHQNHSRGSAQPAASRSSPWAGDFSPRTHDFARLRQHRHLRDAKRLQKLQNEGAFFSPPSKRAEPSSTASSSMMPIRNVQDQSPSPPGITKSNQANLPCLYRPPHRTTLAGPISRCSRKQAATGHHRQQESPPPHIRRRKPQLRPSHRQRQGHPAQGR